MQEMELYHIHKSNNVDKLWVVNNTIKVDENFNSIMNQRQNRFSQLIRLQDLDGTREINFSQYIAEYFQMIQGMKSVRGEDLEELKGLLEVAYQMSFNADFFKRESGLEDCRKDHFEELPSRLHSMYLCDSDGLEYWTDMISNNNTHEVGIYRVLASGKVFKTNEQLLPTELTDYQGVYQGSFKYWKPKFGAVPNFTNEYLATGTVKVLEKIK